MSGAAVTGVGHLPNVLRALHPLDPERVRRLAALPQRVDQFRDRRPTTLRSRPATPVAAPSCDARPGIRQLEHETTGEAFRASLDLLDQHPGLNAVEIGQILVEHHLAIANHRR